MQVAAPTQVTACIAVADCSNIGDRRQTMNTPAVTMVAAWMRALTGVGPSMASGSQVWSGSCADLATAPTRRRKAASSSIDESLTTMRRHGNVELGGQNVPDLSWSKTVEYVTA